MYVYTHICSYVYVHTYTYMSTHIFPHMNIHIHEFTCTYMYEHMYIYIHTCITQWCVYKIYTTNPFPPFRHTRTCVFKCVRKSAWRIYCIISNIYMSCTCDSRTICIDVSHELSRGDIVPWLTWRHWGCQKPQQRCESRTISRGDIVSSVTYTWAVYMSHELYAYVWVTNYIILYALLRTHLNMSRAQTHFSSQYAEIHVSLMKYVCKYTHIQHFRVNAYICMHARLYIYKLVWAYIHVRSYVTFS